MLRTRTNDERVAWSRPDVGPGTPRWMRRLRWIGVALPALAIVLLQTSRPLIAARWGEVAANHGISVLTGVAAVAFGIAMFAVIERGHRVITTQNHELSTINHLLTAIARHEPPDVVTARVDQTLHELLGPRGQRTGSAEEQRLLQSMADLVTLSQTQAELVEQERHEARADELDRIAREMHDSLAQVLSTLHLRLRVLEGLPGQPHAARAEIGRLAELCHSSVQDVREGILGLRSLNRPEQSLTTALAQFVRHHERRGDSSHRVRLEGPDVHLPAPEQLHVLRIVQEALTNVRKHADADETVVRLEIDEQELCIAVVDDGRGFDPEAEQRAGHYGLATMRERSELIGATLDVRSTPGRGTQVQVRLPHPTRRTHPPGRQEER